MQKRVWAFLCILALAAPACARADETRFGVAIIGTHGTHRESGGEAKAPLVPAPVLGISHRFKRFEITAEGLPPIGAIPVSNNGLGMQNIALTYGDATLRYWNKRQTFAVGLGETLYNQRTTFLNFQDAFFRDSTINYSRITGTRYEIVGRVMLPLRNYLQVELAVNPSMHGRYVAAFQDTILAQGRTRTFTTRPEWERASQVDGDIRFVHSFGPFGLSYGIRYLNYTAAFTGRPWSPFADANSFVMPYVALDRTLGH